MRQLRCFRLGRVQQAPPDARQTNGPPASSLSTLVLRFLIVVLSVLAAAIWFKPRYFRARIPRPEIAVFDLTARAQKLIAKSPDDPNLIDWYYEGDHGSAHLDVFVGGATCELHLHEHTEEATIPVFARPLVKEIFGGPHGPVTRLATYDPGTLIVSRRNGAHEWTNQSATEHHATLVLTLGEIFPGNDFVEPTDPRILRAEEPLVFAPRQAAQHRQRASGNLEVPLRSSYSSLSALYLTEALSLKCEGDATLFYVVDGAGRFEVERQSYPLRATTLVVARHRHRARLVPTGSTPLVLYRAQIPS